MINKNEICNNCGKTTAGHHPFTGPLHGGIIYRCKIEGVKIYFNTTHWTGKSIDQIFKKFDNLKSCKCSKYQCWDCAFEDRISCIDANQHTLKRPNPKKITKYQCTRCDKKFTITLNRD